MGPIVLERQAPAVVIQPPVETTVSPSRQADTTETSAPVCREFQTEITIGGKVQRGYGKACRQPDGSWKIVP